MNTSTPQVPIRVGMVGIGNWARHGHVRVLNLRVITTIYIQSLLTLNNWP
jgi:hypothetical protein